MIIETKALSMTETLEMIENKEENKEIIGFIKKFAKLKIKDAGKLREELENAGMMKMKAEHIAKIIDLLPETAVELNKIFVNESLDENETNQILEIVKKYI